MRSTSLPPLVTALLLLPLSSCTWISQRAYEDQRDKLDQDGDGVARVDDCDDTDATVFPGAIDAAYDGLDGDCDGQDLVDIDRDGFPGISAEAYQALGPAQPFPAELVGLPVDCADDPAVVPDAARIYPDPTKAIETPYDAIDADCQGDNDFDVDGDGWMPEVVDIEGVERPTAEVFEDYVAAWAIDVNALQAPPGHARPEVGDCDDVDIDVHPENTIAEVPYDGVDRDCDHVNDYDQDGDCFMPPSAEAGYDDYVQRTYGDRPVPFCVDPERPFGDCLDAADPTIRTIPDGDAPDPATVHPATTAYPTDDVPYDGIDGDCGADNDFDGDLDGFMPTDLPYPPPGGATVTELALTYADTWGYDASGWPLVEADCDDTRDDTWPGALEVIGDGLDQDCFGDPDHTPWGFGDGDREFRWTAPTPPEIVRLADTWVVLVGASIAEIPSAQSEFGVAFPFTLADARNGGIPSDPLPPYWKATSPNLQMQAVLDAAVLPAPVDEDGDGVVDPVVTAAYSTDNVVTSFTHLNVSSLRLFSGTGELSPIGGTTDFVSDAYVTAGIDVIHDPAGDVFAVACAPDWLHMTFSVDPPPPVRGTVEGDPADTCFFHDEVDGTVSPQEAPLTVCAGGSCSEWVATDAPSLEGAGPADGDWVFGDKDGAWISLLDATGAAVVREVGGADEAVLVGKTVLHLDVAEFGGDLFVAAIVDAPGGLEVWLAYGPPGDLEEVELGFDDPEVVGEDPTWVAVEADADRIAVVVTALNGGGLQDSVGWVFLGPPT